MKKLLIAALLIGTGTIVSGQTAQNLPNQKHQLKEYLNFLDNAGFSGQILVAEKGKIVVDQAFGYSNKETLSHVSPTTAFNIASLTKQFTASAILWLEQNGKLKTSDTLGKLWDAIPVDKRDITIHQLLSHTAGFGRQAAQTNDIISKNELLKKIFSTNLVNKPGSTFQYSNSGYEILAAIVEKISGVSFKEFIRQTFVVPNNLTHTYFNTDDLYEINNEIALGYNEWKEVGNSFSSSTNWNNTGASNILSTTEDLYKWFTLIRTDKIINSTQRKKLFAPSTITDEEEEYGYGWYLTKTTTGKQLIYHGGDISGYHSEFRYYPEDDKTIIILTNQELFGYGIFKYRIASNISKIISGTQTNIPTRTIKLKKDDLYKYCGIYQVDSISYFKIWVNGSQLTIGAWGQEAIDLIIPKATRDLANLKTSSEKSLRLINSVLRDDDEMAKQIISTNAFGFYYPALKENYKAYANAMGDTPSVSLAGSIPAYWSGNNISRTYLHLNFPSGNSIFYFGWTPKDIFDITVNNDRPFPLIYPLLFSDQNKCLVYDLDNSNSIEMKFNADKKGVIKSLKVTDEIGNLLVFKKVK
jgi:CubicO group peptidase (beta-lactamase class C family)